MLPYTGENAADWDKALDWAVENINLNGGVAGRFIELVKKDIGSCDPLKTADDLIADPAIKAVIGPLTSSEVFALAPRFITGGKLLLAPLASAASVSRAFAGYNYFWRLAEPDISQTKTLLLLAQKGGAHKVALITEESEYGASFEDWFGYFATELGLEVSGIKVVNPGDSDSSPAVWKEIADGGPDAVIVAINSPIQCASFARAFRYDGRQLRLLFSDGALMPSLINGLGSLAENLEGTAIASDPTSGFDISWKVRYGNFPEAFMANVYDAVMLAALALEASGGEGGAPLAEALKRVVSGREGRCRWNRDELKNALDLIRRDIYPDIKGASGELNFDELYFTDVSSTTYGHWRVDAGQFVITDFYTSDSTGRISSTSAAYRVIADKKQQFLLSGAWPVVDARSGTFAFLMATSQGWSNYRHQADVLKTYQLLRARGIDDDHIILVLADDIATSPSNPDKGVVINEAGGVNLYIKPVIDYKLDQISSRAVADILTGNVGTDIPIVLNTTMNDNILIFTSGHGTPDGMSLEGKNSATLSPEFWKSVFDEMYRKKNYRRIFWACEACYSGKVGEAVSTPGVMMMTGANPFETSKAYLYDPDLKNWLADKFAFSVNNTIATAPNLHFNELYERCFTFVNGSHISFYNYNNFGNIYQLSLNEFITP